MTIIIFLSQNKITTFDYKISCIIIFAYILNRKFWLLNK